jgi:hypothetical protein
MALGVGTNDPARALRPTWIGARGKMLARAAFLIACMAAVRDARADPATVDQAPVDQAAELFRQGREAMKGGNYRGACALFEASQRLDPAPGTLLNVAVCSEKLGRLRRATTALEAFLATVNSADDRRARAAALLADVSERTPRVSIRVPAWASARAQVLVDGEGIAPEVWKAAMPLDPGRHVLEVRVPSGADQRRTLEVKERDRLVETFVFSQTRAPKADRHASPTRRGDLPAAFYVSLGVGVGGLVAAAGARAIVMQEAATVEKECENKQCNPAGLEAGERGKRFLTVGAVALPIGVAGTALAGYLWFRGKPGASPSVGITVAPTQAVLSAAGTF